MASDPAPVSTPPEEPEEPWYEEEPADSSNIGDDQPKPEDAQPKPEDADDEGPLDSDEEQELQDGESIPRAGEQDDDGGETGDENNWSKREMHAEDTEHESHREATRAKICIPVFPKPSENSSICALKLPKMVALCKEEFDVATHDPTSDAQTFGESVSVMRWRYKRNQLGKIMHDDQGRPLRNYEIDRESNARLVKWTDGTKHLIVGDDTYNVTFQPLRHSYLYSNATSRPPNTAADHDLPDELDFGKTAEIEAHEWRKETQVYRQSCLECHAQIQHSLKIAPMGLHTAQHKRFTQKAQAATAAHRKNLKTQGIRYEEIKELGQKSKLLDQQFHTKAKQLRRQKRKEAKASADLGSGFLEGSEDRQRKRRRTGTGRKDEDDSDNEDDDAFVEGDNDEEDDELDGVEDEEEEEEEEDKAEAEETDVVEPRHKRSQKSDDAVTETPKPTRRRVVEDDDDDE